MTEDFDKRLVIVSGASSGIGRASAIALSRAGARLALLGRREDRLRETAALCADPAQVEVVVVDLQQTDHIAPTIIQLAARVGGIFGICHCAGTIQTLPLPALNPARVLAAFQVNFLAGVELARAVTRRDVLDTSGGSMVWLASVSAHVGSPGQIAYSASKGAVVSAVRSMALELAPRRFRVNSLSPGVVETEMSTTTRTVLSHEQWSRVVAMHPLGIGSAEDVARAVVFMLSPASKWLTGADWILDGGYTLA